jgi:integrase
MGGREASVYGPYRDGRRFRVVFIEGGVRKAKLFATREEAQSVALSLASTLSQATTLPIGSAVDEFLRSKHQGGLKPSSLRAWEDRLRQLPADTGLAEFSPTDAQALYDAWRGRYAAATHRSRLRSVRGFFGWALERGYIARNPFTGVKPQGKPRRGKPQPRVDEARVLYSELLRLAQGGDDRAACLLLQLLHGTRSSETWSLRVRDVDAEGTRLCIASEGGKTSSATRTLAIEVPALQQILMQRRQGKAAAAYLFELGGKRVGNVANAMLWKFLDRLCRTLAIPPICPHALRGLHATLALQQGTTSAAVARALGHRSDEVTRRHYFAPGAEQAETMRQLAALLSGKPGPAGSAVVDLLDRVQSLSPEDRRAFLAAVAGKT